MKISFGTRINELSAINGTNGYGYATHCMLDSLQRLGYHVSPNDTSADVEIWFDQPQNWNFSTGPYRIGYHPWESTQLQPEWPDIMNECDEIWTPSPIVADWYRRYAGVRVPVYVYEHGIEHSWSPQHRKPVDKIKFLHVGAESARKGGWDLVRAFRKAFLTRDDVSLTLKVIQQNWLQLPGIGKIAFINGRMDFPQLQELFYDHHVYAYPSAGEGFGLTPLQAIASGMPTITVPDWAPYDRFLEPDLKIKARLARTKWPKIHPGEMFIPDMDDCIDRLRYAADNFETISQNAFDTAPRVHTSYDWDTITDQVFTDLEKRLISQNIL